MVVLDGVNYLTVEEACTLMGVKPATIYAYVSRGTLHSYKQGIKRQRLYREDEVTALMAIQPSVSRLPATQDEPPPAVAAPGNALPPAEWWMSEI